MNCPSCQAPLPQQSNYCNNCGKGLQPQFTLTQEDTTKKYQKFILFFVILMMSVNVLYWFFDLADYYGGPYVKTNSISKIISPFITLTFYSIPLAAGFIFPKNSARRKLLIIIGSIYLLIKIALMIKFYFFAPDPFTYFKF